MYGSRRGMQQRGGHHMSSYCQGYGEDTAPCFPQAALWAAEAKPGTMGGFWNSRGERQITRLKKLTMTEGTRGSKLGRGWMNDVTTKAKATLMRCSMQSLPYNTFMSATKSSTAQHTLSDPERKIPSSPALPPLVCLLCVCVHAMTTTSHNRAGRANTDPAPVENPCQSAAPAPDPPSASANVLADGGRQPFNGLFHVWEQSHQG